MVGRYCNRIIDRVEFMMKELKMKILLWIQGWSGQLNSWAWNKWDKLHREDWVKGYDKWKKK